MTTNEQLKKILDTEFDVVCGECDSYLHYEIDECEIIIEPCDECLDAKETETRKEIEAEQDMDFTLWKCKNCNYHFALEVGAVVEKYENMCPCCGYKHSGRINCVTLSMG